MKHSNSRSGFVLVFSLVVLGAAAIILGGIFSYLSFTTRATMRNIAKSDCRLAAQSMIDLAKVGIDIAFTKFSGKSAGVRIGPRSGDAYDWFEYFYPNNIIGKGGGVAAGTAYQMPGVTNINGCVVRPRFGGFLRDGNCSWADVIIVATASLNTNGIHSSVTIEERIRFATERSKVFDYAYFVNNYGWFNGSGCTANGDVRANGDLYLGECVINGEAWAAKNDELGVPGKMTNDRGVMYPGKFQTLNDYWNSAKTSMIRPSSPTATPTAVNDYEWAGGYVVPKDADERCHPYQESGIPMPWIGDLQNEYVPYAQELGGNLSGGKRYTMSQAGEIVSQANERINAHYNGNGPSGRADLADKGSIVLEGTKENPIRIDGPVVIDGDVLIKGYVTGQGTIYAGRNIHIIGNVKYLNPPSWPHPDTNPQATKAKNATKDLVGFAAKGNIVFGNCTEESWKESLDGYINASPYVQEYACDSSDANIGYPAIFGQGDGKGGAARTGQGNYYYMRKDGLNKVDVQTKQVPYVAPCNVYQNKKTKEIFYSEPSGYRDRWGNVNTRDFSFFSPGQTYYMEEKVPVNVNDSHYYDTVCYKNLISGLCDSAAITQIDGVLYNNHGIFGKIGACTFNGSLICRNEGIIYSSSLKINWDIRLKSGSDEAIDNAQVGLPVGAALPCTVAWHESAEEYYTTNSVPGRVTY